MRATEKKEEKKGVRRRQKQEGKERKEKRMYVQYMYICLRDPEKFLEPRNQIVSCSPTHAIPTVGGRVHLSHLSLKLSAVPNQIDILKKSEK